MYLSGSAPNYRIRLHTDVYYQSLQSGGLTIEHTKLKSCFIFLQNKIWFLLRMHSIFIWFYSNIALKHIARYFIPTKLLRFHFTALYEQERHLYLKLRISKRGSEQNLSRCRYRFSFHFPFSNCTIKFKVTPRARKFSEWFLFNLRSWKYYDTMFRHVPASKLELV